MAYARADARRVAGASGPLAAGAGWRFSGPNSSRQIHLARIAWAGIALSVGDLVELQDTVLLGLEVGIARLLPGLYPLKGDAFRVEQLVQALVADVLYHLLFDQVLGELGQAPGRERQVVIARARERDLLDLAALGLGVLRRAPATVAGIEGIEAIGVEVADYVADTVRARERDPRDLGRVHALGG